MYYYVKYFYTLQTYVLTSELLLHLRVGESYEENLQTYHHIHHPLHNSI